MRYVKIPTEPITVRSDNGDPALNADGTTVDPITFAGWLGLHVLFDVKFGKTAQSLMMAADIKQKVEQANGVLELSEGEWDAVVGVVNEPTGGYNPRVALQLIPYIRAMLDATNAA